MNSTGEPGSIPQRRRKLIVVSCALMFVVVTGCCLLINTLVGSPVSWYWLVVAGLVATGLLAAWFWVRLSN